MTQILRLAEAWKAHGKLAATPIVKSPVSRWPPVVLDHCTVKAQQQADGDITLAYAA